MVRRLFVHLRLTVPFDLLFPRLLCVYTFPLFLPLLLCHSPSIRFRKRSNHPSNAAELSLPYSFIRCWISRVPPASFPPWSTGSHHRKIGISHHEKRQHRLGWGERRDLLSFGRGVFRTCCVSILISPDTLLESYLVSSLSLTALGSFFGVCGDERGLVEGTDIPPSPDLVQRCVALLRTHPCVSVHMLML